MMKIHPVRFLCRCALYLHLHVPMRFLRREKIIILMYHGFTDKKADGGIENGQGLHLDIEKFRSQIGYLKRFYNIVSLEQLIDSYANGTKLPPNSVVITIDDGYKSSYTLAYPVLKQANVPAAVFLTTDFIDKKEMLWIDRVEYAISRTGTIRDNDSKNAHYNEIVSKLKSMPQESVRGAVEALEKELGEKLSDGGDTPDIYRPLEWDEVLAMAKGGLMSIGSHTCSHVILTRCSPDRREKELSLSKRIIEDKTGRACRLFCYPNGAAGDFDCQTRTLLKKTRYSCGLTTVAGVNDKRSDVFELKRLSVDAREDLAVFIMTLSGIFKFLSDIKQAMVKR